MAGTHSAEDRKMNTTHKVLRHSWLSGRMKNGHLNYVANITIDMCPEFQSSDMSKGKDVTGKASWRK